MYILPIFSHYDGSWDYKMLLSQSQYVRQDDSKAHWKFKNSLLPKTACLLLLMSNVYLVFYTSIWLRGFLSQDVLIQNKWQLLPQTELWVNAEESNSQQRDSEIRFSLHKTKAFLCIKKSYSLKPDRMDNNTVLFKKVWMKWLKADWSKEGSSLCFCPFCSLSLWNLIEFWLTFFSIHVKWCGWYSWGFWMRKRNILLDLWIKRCR